MCAPYQQYFLQPLLEYIQDKQAEVRQAAAYGCGVLGQVSYTFNSFLISNYNARNSETMFNHKSNSDRRFCHFVSAHIHRFHCKI